MTLSQAVNAERLMLFGWGRAILLQLAHPLIAAGVHEHSSFRASPVQAVARLHHTIHAMLALTFGDEAATAAALDTIRGIHRRVHGVLPADAGRFRAGTPYSAEDPDLLLWVHVTLLDSVVLVYERLIRPMSAAERDQYSREAAWVPLALGARDADVPRDWEGVQRALAAGAADGCIAVSAQAQELADAVLSPRMAFVVAPLAWMNRTVTVGLLPDMVRRQYGYAWSPGRDRALARTLRLLAAARRITPAPLAYWPEARRRLRTPSPSRARSG